LARARHDGEAISTDGNATVAPVNPVVEGGLISGGTAIVVQAINWGRDVTTRRSEERRVSREINERRLDELRAILDAAALALRTAQDKLRGASRTGARDTADASYSEFTSALQDVGIWHTRLAVRLGQTDPLVEALKDASRALEGIAPDLRHLQGPHPGVVLNDEQKGQILAAQTRSSAAALNFEHRAAAVVGPELTERVPRGDVPPDTAPTSGS
jgi:hypothetical protein